MEMKGSFIYLFIFTVSGKWQKKSSETYSSGSITTKRCCKSCWTVVSFFYCIILHHKPLNRTDPEGKMLHRLRSPVSPGSIFRIKKKIIYKMYKMTNSLFNLKFNSLQELSHTQYRVLRAAAENPEVRPVQVQMYK